MAYNEKVQSTLVITSLVKTSPLVSTSASAGPKEAHSFLMALVSTSLLLARRHLVGPEGDITRVDCIWQKSKNMANAI
jgi:hypothetical protein